MEICKELKIMVYGNISNRDANTYMHAILLEDVTIFK